MWQYRNPIVNTPNMHDRRGKSPEEATGARWKGGDGTAEAPVEVISWNRGRLPFEGEEIPLTENHHSTPLLSIMFICAYE
jgi:hypothetical protein